CRRLTITDVALSRRWGERNGCIRVEAHIATDLRSGVDGARLERALRNPEAGYSRDCVSLPNWTPGQWSRRSMTRAAPCRAPGASRVIRGTRGWQSHAGSDYTTYHIPRRAGSDPLPTAVFGAIFPRLNSLLRGHLRCIAAG